MVSALMAEVLEEKVTAIEDALRAFSLLLDGAISPERSSREEVSHNCRDTGTSRLT